MASLVSKCLSILLSKKLVCAKFTSVQHFLVAFILVVTSVILPVVARVDFFLSYSTYFYTYYCYFFFSWPSSRCFHWQTSKLVAVFVGRVLDVFFKVSQRFCLLSWKLFAVFVGRLGRLLAVIVDRLRSDLLLLAVFEAFRCFCR